MTEAMMHGAATPEFAGTAARRESPPSMIERMTLILDAFNGPPPG